MNLNLDDAKSLLPDSALLLVEIIGFEATMALVEALGGVPMPIGKGVLARGDVRLDMLRQAVGEENTQKLMDAFGGEEIYIPNCYRAMRACRWQSFLADFDALQNQKISVLMALTRLCPIYKVTYKQAMKTIAERRWHIQGDEQPQLPFS